MDLLILGASARSAAGSASRIGLRPTCADLFADLDLAAIGPATRIPPGDYPDGLVAFADALPPTPWLYTGALENRPDLVDRIALRHPLLGNPGSRLRLARDPVALASAARSAGLPAPGVRLDPSGIPADGTWLVKPLASAGGRGIRPWRGDPEPGRRPVYYQERVSGLPMAALFVGDASGARFAGITRQFVGRPGSPFGYRGSLGPWPVPEETRRRIEDLGRAVARSSGLLGLFGVDLILRDGQPWPIEVNPRYSASVEVLEWATGRSLLAEHLRAFGREVGAVMSNRPHGFVGKAILHSDRPLRWPGAAIGPPTGPGSLPGVADIPEPGTRFGAGEPVLSVFARGDGPEDCRRRLGAGLASWRRRLRALASDLGVDHQEEDGGGQEDAEDGPAEPERLPPDPGPGLVA